MKKKIIMIIIAIIVLIAIASIAYQLVFKNNDILSNYIAVFHGGSGEMTYSTYIYKIDNGHYNYGFKYINTENTTKSYGSSDWIIRKTGEGTVDWTDGVFKVAYENNAYDYVQLPNDSKTYTIEEFQNMFLMN